MPSTSSSPRFSRTRRRRRQEQESPHPADTVKKPAPTRILVKGGKNRKGLLNALESMAIDLRYNKRSARLEFLKQAEDFQKWANSDDMIRAALRERISEEFLYTAKEGPVPLTIGKDRFADLIEALLDSRRVDPFKEWLDNLPAWDGESRLDFWLSGCFTIGDITSDLLRWASSSVLMGAVARTDTPGEKHDEMVILVGSQGLGKSTVWAWLLPPANRRQWFSDALKFHADVKTQVEVLQGRVIVEAAEMSGSTRAEIESIKAFLARQDDGAVRLTYRRDPIDLPRRCVIVGSTNDPRCLPNDPSGQPALCAGPRVCREPESDSDLHQPVARSTVGRSGSSSAGEQGANVAARRPKRTADGAERTLPGDRRDRRGCRAGVVSWTPGQRDDPADS